MLHLEILLPFLAIVSGYVDGKGEAILRTVPKSTFQLKLLRHLSTEVGIEVDYLNQPRHLNRPADIIVPSRDLNLTQDILNKFKVSNWVLEHNIETLVQREKRAVLDIADADVEISREMLLAHYLSFDMQMRVMEKLAAALPGLVRLEKLGTSFEGRPIMAAFIGIPSHFKKPIFWIDAGIHAREWIAPATALHTLWEYATNPKHYDLLKQIDVVIAPNVNPDGYEYSRLSKRLWRKTRSNTTNEKCVGVDGNRNYPFQWGKEGVNFDPCDNVYCGPHAASEPEVQAIIKAITARKERIQGYVTLHSYSQLILYPWGHSKNAYPDDVEDLIEMAHEMANAIKSVRGNEYEVENSGTDLYPSSGAADDWAKSVGIKYAYTIELPPNYGGGGSFILPEKYISQTVIETFAGLNVLAKKIGQGVSVPIDRKPSHRKIWHSWIKG